MVCSPGCERGQSSADRSSLEYFLKPGGLKLDLQGQVRALAQTERERAVRRGEHKQGGGRGPGRDEQWCADHDCQESSHAGFFC